MLCKVRDYLENLIIIRSLLHLHGVGAKRIVVCFILTVVRLEDHLCYTVGYAFLKNKIFLHQILSCPLHSIKYSNYSTLLSQYFLSGTKSFCHYNIIS